MERAEAYDKLLERVRKAGGYFAFDEKNRPLATTSDGETISVAALFEGTDDSSPLKLISSSFICWDVDDYITTVDLERMCFYVEVQLFFWGFVGVLKM